MSSQVLAVRGTGLVTSVGLNAPAACAAIRAKLTNPSETRFVGRAGEAIMSHAVPLDQALRGLAKLAQMAAMAADECLTDVPRDTWERIPILLCVAERNRPGRLDGLDDRLIIEVCARLGGARFSADSGVVAQGRVGVGVALLKARQLLYASPTPAVLIIAADSLLTWPTLKVFEEQERLLTDRNSNGFIPGEAASALLVSSAIAGPHLEIAGLGFANEQATIEKEEPLRGVGLSLAINQSLQDAGCEMRDVDFRITDISGEQYYFKEAALALARTLKSRKEEFDIWHPAECIGEVGSAIGPAMFAVAEAAGRKAYAPGPMTIMHAANDAGERTAVVTRYVVS
jgi:3-oxoacyl-[acyl-carrier-protein] synthase-1